MNCETVAAFPAASRSRVLNRPLSSGHDGRSATGRALRDLTASLLVPLGKNPSARAVLLAKAAAKAWLALSSLEDLEATSADVAIQRAGAIADAARRLGKAVRALDALLANEAKPEAGDSLEAYLKKQAAPAA